MKRGEGGLEGGGLAVESCCFISLVNRLYALTISEVERGKRDEGGGRGEESDLEAVGEKRERDWPSAATEREEGEEEKTHRDKRTKKQPIYTVKRNECNEHNEY